jgi:hypothetical protein
VTGSFGITGLHPVAIRKAFEDFVGILELPRATIGIPKNKLRKAND